MKCEIILTILIVLLGSLNLKAETNGAQVVIEPEHIVRLSLSYSLKLKSLTREFDAASAQNKIARSQELPQVAMNANYYHYTGLNDFSMPFLTIPEIQNKYNAALTITQPVYSGGRIKSLKQSTTLLKYSITEDKKAGESDIILQASDLYWNWSKAYHQLQALETAVKRMEAHTKDINALKKAGMATENDALSTEVLLDQTRLQYEEANRRLELILSSIALTTGEKLSTNFIPIKPSSPDNITVLLEEDLYKTALRARPERAARIYEVQSLDERVKTARSEYYPQISLVARYEQAKPNMLDFPPRDVWQDDAFAGVVMSWNIFDWGVRTAKVREASARRDQAHLKLEQIDDQILFQIRSARIKLMDAFQRLGVSRRLLASAEKNLNVSTDLWKNGLSRHSDVLDAHTQLTDAQFAIISDSADLKIALIELDYAIGIIATTFESNK